MAGIPGLRVLGRPAASLVALAAETGADGAPLLDVGAVADGMRDRGWHLQPQLAFGGAPASLHLTIDTVAAGTTAAMLVDLAGVAAQAVAAPATSLPPELAGLLAGLRPADVTTASVGGLLTAAGLDGANPAVDARVNAMLQLMPPDTRGAVVTLVADLLFTASRSAAGGGRADPPGHR